jgi:glycerate 2-kinase
LRVLVCPQEFKGSLTAAEAARAIAAGVRLAIPGAEVELLPMADGGAGTLEIVCTASDGEFVPMDASGPLGSRMTASYALLPTRRDGARAAVVEAAATAGLTLVSAAQRQPGRASTFGVGEQLVVAASAGADEIIVSIGGTGTNDGGAGAAQALGFRLLDAHDESIGPGPLELLRLRRIKRPHSDRLARVRVRVAVDVRNPLLGPEGATRVFGPQKGVTSALLPELERALRRWADVVERDLGVPIAGLPGGGAGGGLAAGLVATTSATIESGAALVGEAVGLAAAIARADVVITGEGRLDAQTAYGKTVAHVLEQSLAAGRPCLAVAGSIDALPAGMSDAEAAALPGEPIEAAMAHAAKRVEAAAERLLRRAQG